MDKVVALPISEAKLQQVVTEWMELALGSDVFWTCFPAGGGGLVRGAQLKSRGLRPGVPDILIVYRSEAYFIELKTRIGKLSSDQVECHEALSLCGARVAVCRCLPDIAMALRRWEIPYRVTA